MKTTRRLTLVTISVIGIFGCGDNSSRPGDDSHGDTADTTGPHGEGGTSSTTNPDLTSSTTAAPTTTDDTVEASSSSSSGSGSVPGETSSGDVPGETSSGSTTDDTTSGVLPTPTIIETIPADGAVGVRADAVLVVRFSEPMDKALVQQAYQSATIPAAFVTFGWNNLGDELTITPTGQLPYAKGTNPNTLDPLQFTYNITTVAKSENGVALGSSTDVSFTTLRRLTQTLGRDLAMSGNVDSLGQVKVSDYIGDNHLKTTYRYGLTFDLLQLAPTIDTVESAKFSAAWDIDSGDPWVGLGSVVFQHVSYPAFASSVYDTPGLGNATGLFAMPNDTSVTKDVAPQLAIVFKNPKKFGERLQLLLRWFLDTDNDNQVDGLVLVPASLKLVVQYLSP